MAKKKKETQKTRKERLYKESLKPKLLDIGGGKKKLLPKALAPVDVKPYVRYRGMNGKLVAERNLDGKTKVKVEIWRYRSDIQRTKKLVFEGMGGWVKRKKPISELRLMELMKKAKKKHKLTIKLRMIRGKVHYEAIY